ncbi:MAG: ABC transporter permease [Myxococcota bacterium]
MKTVRSSSGFRVFFGLELRETVLSRWFQVYMLGFAAVLGLFFAFGLAESQIMGFQGLGRTLLTFFRATLVILPLFVLLTTARTLVEDRDSGAWEYMLAFPFSLSSYYWGRFWGRALGITSPLVLALFAGGLVEAIRGRAVPWGLIAGFAAIVAALVACFLGVAMLISVTSRAQETAIAGAFAVWLSVEALVDALLLGLLIRAQLSAEVVLGIAMLNPVQAGRVASIGLFEPELSMLGPLSYTLLDELGSVGIFIWALAWPFAIGLAAAAVGLWSMKKNDMV